MLFLVFYMTKFWLPSVQLCVLERSTNFGYACRNEKGSFILPMRKLEVELYKVDSSISNLFSFSNLTHTSRIPLYNSMRYSAAWHWKTHICMPPTPSPPQQKKGGGLWKLKWERNNLAFRHHLNSKLEMTIKFVEKNTNHSQNTKSKEVWIGSWVDKVIKQQQYWVEDNNSSQSILCLEPRDQIIKHFQTPKQTYELKSHSQWN